RGAENGLRDAFVRSLARRRYGVSGAAAAEVAAHSGKRALAGGNSWLASKGVQGKGLAASRTGRAGRLRGEISLRTLRRHAAARGHRARAGARPEAGADG